MKTEQELKSWLVAEEVRTSYCVGVRVEVGTSQKPRNLPEFQVILSYHCNKWFSFVSYYTLQYSYVSSDYATLCVCDKRLRQESPQLRIDGTFLLICFEIKPSAFVIEGAENISQVTSLPTDPSSASHSNYLQMPKETEDDKEVDETLASETVDDAGKKYFPNLSNQVGNCFIFRGHLAYDDLANTLNILLTLISKCSDHGIL